MTVETIQLDVQVVRQALEALQNAQQLAPCPMYEQAVSKLLGTVASQRAAEPVAGDRLPVLYTDTINGDQVMRDDLWLCTTAALRNEPPKSAPSVPEDVMNVVRAIHRRPSDAHAWLDELIRIIRIYTTPQPTTASPSRSRRASNE